MNLKRSPLAMKDKKQKNLDNSKDYPTLSDLIREQNVSNNELSTVHHRRDLDSLG